MSNSNTCSCCAGISIETPGLVNNLPGLNAVAYRVGTQPLFLESMLANLTASGQPALYGLTTRNPDDFTIAFLDAWATVSDVLTFYQERIANESWLRTATEQLSVVQLARLIGYEMQPGVAASTYLSFVVSNAAPVVLPTSTTATIPPPVVIGPGTQVQSVPSPGQQTQTFETVESITARVEWNALLPRLTKQQQLATGASSVLLNGTATALDIGDILLLIDAAGNRILRKVASLSLDPKGKTTLVGLAGLSPSATTQSLAAAAAIPSGSLSSFDPTTTFSAFVTMLTTQRWEAADIQTIVQTRQWSMGDLVSAVSATLANPTNYTAQVYAMRKQALIFGYNAPLQVTYDATTGHLNLPSAWTDWPLAESSNLLYLETAYSGILPNSYIGIQQPQSAGGATPIDICPVIQILGADVGSRSAYGISSRTTALTLASAVPWNVSATLKLSTVRQLTFYTQSEPLPMADTPDTKPVEGNKLVLGGFYPGLHDGQHLILTGNRNDVHGTSASELITVQDVTIELGLTVLTFVDNLTNSYVRSSVTLNANVALATHGQTIQETLGNGDATQVFQSFTLKQAPLTYVTAASAGGIATTLEIYVSNILWQEVPYFYGHEPGETIYITRQDDSGKTTVTFGDGNTGARLPTGSGNIQATYRQGIGTAGILGANQLTQLTIRPPGVKSVTNALPSNGAADPEDLSDGRSNATLTIMTLDRVVSLDDYMDFARAYAGIGKALATWTWHAQKRSIYLTLAGVNGAPIDPTSQLYSDLKKAIWSAGDPDVPLVMVSYQPKYFLLQANILPDPLYIEADVVAFVIQALLNAFSFATRSFGQPVALSEVITVAQQVEGVVAVDVTAFNLSSDANTSIQNLLGASMPQPGAYAASPAELLMIDSGSLQINTIPS
jgi:hypothetical protein